MEKNPLTALSKLITATRVTHCGKSGVASVVKLPSVAVSDGELKLVLEVFISDAGNVAISGVSYLDRKEYSAGQITELLEEWAEHCAHEGMRNAALWILKVWGLYHLNDMKAGTPEQHAALAELPRSHDSGSWYTAACALLKDKGLYEVEWNGKPYRFGSAWLTHPVPESDLRLMRAAFAPEFFKL